jgi:hypothetical protein
MNPRTLSLSVSLTTIPLGATFAEPATPSSPPVVEATSLTEEQLRGATIGKTIYLSISGFELPIHYKANGRMTGSMGAVAATFSRGDARVTVAVGGPRPTSFASVGQVGWTGKPIATRSSAKAIS